MAPGKCVLVVGAGIVGSSVSLTLARKGCKVHLFDGSSAAASAATGKSWAWLNANKKNPEHYQELNMAGMDEWLSHFSHLVHRRGALLLGDAQPSLNPRYPCEVLTPQQLQHLEPHTSVEYASSSGMPIQLYRQESWVDPVEAVQYMVSEAVRSGAEVHLGEAVEKVHLEPDLGPAADQGGSGAEEISSGHDNVRITGVTTSTGRQYSGDALVLACGTGVSQLAHQAGVTVPLLYKPAVVAFTEPVKPGQLTHMVCTPEVFIVQRPDGSFLIGGNGVSEDSSGEAGQELLAAAARVLPVLQNAAIKSIEVGHRPWPADGYPAVGSCAAVGRPNLYLGVMHSGLTLGPYVGRLLAEEVAAGEDVNRHLLEPYRPCRSFQATGQPAYGWMDTTRK